MTAFIWKASCFHYVFWLSILLSITKAMGKRFSLLCSPSKSIISFLKFKKILKINPPKSHGSTIFLKIVVTIPQNQIGIIPLKL